MQVCARARYVLYLLTETSLESLIIMYIQDMGLSARVSLMSNSRINSLSSVYRVVESRLYLYKNTAVFYLDISIVIFSNAKHTEKIIT